MSVCGCCKACAKVPGEYCGGVFGTNGRCDEGLACVTISKPYRIADDHHELGKCGKYKQLQFLKSAEESL